MTKYYYFFFINIGKNYTSGESVIGKPVGVAIPYWRIK